MYQQTCNYSSSSFNQSENNVTNNLSEFSSNYGYSPVSYFPYTSYDSSNYSSNYYNYYNNSSRQHYYNYEDYSNSSSFNTSSYFSYPYTNTSGDSISLVSYNLSNECCLSPLKTENSKYSSFNYNTSPSLINNDLHSSSAVNSTQLSSPIQNNHQEYQIQSCNSSKLTSSPILSNNVEKTNKSKKTVSKKHQLSDHAVDIMNEWFEEHLNNPYPTSEEKERMAALGKITVKQVTAWFSNRRNRTQNTKPKRMKRVLEREITDIFQELVHSTDKQKIIQKFKNTLVNRELSL